MQLTEFSVTNFRSIYKTEPLKLSSYSVFAGQNNEGKSNLLQALVMGLRTLDRDLTGDSNRRAVSMVRARRNPRLHGAYSWHRDFPLDLQLTHPGRKTVLRYHFTLDSDECSAFETDVGHAINGSLKINVEFGRTQRPRVTFPKGRYSRDFESKRDAISTFLARRVSLRYIPAIRGSAETFDIVDDLVAQQLLEARQTPALAEALADLEAAQRPLLESLQDAVRETVAGLLPDVSAVDIELQPASTSSRVASVTMDDGQRTSLDLKGDGVQSLTSIALAQHHAVTGPNSPFVILAVEEPEAHLHPSAVHQINLALRKMSEDQQVLVTTHSPLLINRGDVSANVIVGDNSARHATSLAELRDVLGVRPADNLRSASLMVLVEGLSDVRIVDALLRQSNEKIDTAFTDGSVALFSCGGASQIPSQVRIHRNQVFACHVLLDNDEAGRGALRKLRDADLLKPSQVSLTNITGRQNTELEDLIDPSVYSEQLLDLLGVDTTKIHKGLKKTSPGWSDRLKSQVMTAGHPWDERVENEAKAVVASAVVSNPSDALLKPGRDVMNQVAEVLSRRLDAVATAG